MKAKKCELWIGTHWNFFKWGDFKSINSAKKYVKECINCYYAIKIKN